MLRILRQGQRWILWFVILIVGAVFVIYLGLPGLDAGPAGAGVVVQVDGRRYFPRDVQRLREATEERYQRQLGPGFNPALLGDVLDEGAARELLQIGLLASEAERLGLRVTDREVRDYLRRIPGAADSEGRLDRDVITGFAEREFGSLRRFQEALRDELLAGKMRLLLRESVALSDAEARDAVLLASEEVDIAYVVLDPEQIAEKVEIEDARVQELLSADPERVRSRYEERIAEFDRPEQVRARHVLIRSQPDASEEQKAAARQRAEAALARIQGGEDFAALAKELSEDPGSSAEGGDVGFFARGSMAPPFEEAAFALQPGEMSSIVETPFGFHVIRVEERREAERRSLETVREDLARELLREEAAAGLARKRAEELAEAVRSGSTLTEAARNAGLSLERPDPLRRSPDGRVPALGVAPDVVSAAFAAEPGKSLDRVFEVEDRLVLVELLARREATPEEVEAQLPATRDELLSQLREEIERTWIETRAEELREAGGLVYDLTALRSR